MENNQQQFIRIAMARLKSRYKFKPQRLAIASKMYVTWLNRKKNEKE